MSPFFFCRRPRISCRFRILIVGAKPRHGAKPPPAQAPRAHTEVLHDDVKGLVSTPNGMKMKIEDED